MLPDRRRTLLTLVSLGILYTVWGSTYLAQRVAVSSFEPLLMAGVRFVIAGGLLYTVLRARGAKAPAAGEWRAVVLSATPLLVGGMGGGAIGIKRVPSGLAALVFGSVPLWTSLFDWLLGGRLRRVEVLGLAAGFAGVLVVSLRGGLSSDPAGAAILLGAAASYALGCVATRRLPIPRGLMGTAAQMLTGGILLTALALAKGDRLPEAPSARALGALVYLVVLGSLIAYAAFGWLMKNARPALATSYAFVNPVVALGVGAALGGERFGGADLAGLALVLGAVGLVAWGARTTAGERPPAPSRPVPVPSRNGQSAAPCLAAVEPVRLRDAAARGESRSLVGAASIRACQPDRNPL